MLAPTGPDLAASPLRRRNRPPPATTYRGPHTRRRRRTRSRTESEPGSRAPGRPDQRHRHQHPGRPTHPRHRDRAPALPLRPTLHPRLNHTPNAGRRQMGGYWTWRAARTVEYGRQRRFDEVLGWCAECTDLAGRGYPECWRGPVWTRVSSPQGQDLHRRRLYCGDGFGLDRDGRDLVLADWYVHIAPAEELAARWLAAEAVEHARRKWRPPCTSSATPVPHGPVSGARPVYMRRLRARGGPAHPPTD